MKYRKYNKHMYDQTKYDFISSAQIYKRLGSRSGVSKFQGLKDHRYYDCGPYFHSREPHLTSPLLLISTFCPAALKHGMGMEWNQI